MSTMEPDEGSRPDDQQAEAPRWENPEAAGTDDAADAADAAGTDDTADAGADDADDADDAPRWERVGEAEAGSDDSTDS